MKIIIAVLAGLTTTITSYAMQSNNNYYQQQNLLDDSSSFTPTGQFPQYFQQSPLMSMPPTPSTEMPPLFASPTTQVPPQFPVPVMPTPAQQPSQHTNHLPNGAIPITKESLNESHKFLVFLTGVQKSTAQKPNATELEKQLALTTQELCALRSQFNAYVAHTNPIIQQQHNMIVKLYQMSLTLTNQIQELKNMVGDVTNTVKLLAKKKRKK